MKSLFRGSSPLMRGIPGRNECYLYPHRIIPAHAGNTTGITGFISGTQDHPRSCGEYALGHGTVKGFTGSSPLMRGIPHGLGAFFQCSRIIPAHAGNTLWFFCFIAASEDHPRLCGEYGENWPNRGEGLGSSPLMRGIRFPLLMSSMAKRIIPAHAGNTKSQRRHARPG